MKLVARFQLVYPVVLATFETLGAASLKAISGLMALVSRQGDTTPFVHPMLYIVLGVWLGCVAMTVIWLR